MFPPVYIAYFTLLSRNVMRSVVLVAMKYLSLSHFYNSFVYQQRTFDVWNDIVYKLTNRFIWYMHKVMLFIYVHPSTWVLRVQMIFPKQVLVQTQGINHNIYCLQYISHSLFAYEFI